MKKIIFAILLLSVSRVACKKDYQGETYDFSNSVEPYVTLTSTAERKVKQDTTINFTFQMRTALQQTVTVTYSVTGAINKPDQTVIIDRDKTTAVAPLVIPGNLVTAPATTATATLTLVKAVTADGKNLSIGHSIPAANQKVVITIRK